MGLNYPTNFFKSRVVLFEIIIFNTELNKSTFMRDEILFIYYSPQKKQKLYSIGIFRVLKQKKNHKKSHFRYFTISLWVHSFQCKGVSHASSDRIIYLNKNKLAPNHYIVKSQS